MQETYWERKFWQPDIETMPREKFRELQKKKLFLQLIYAYENAPLYKELYDKEKIDPHKIATIEDFQKYVPLVDKDMVREYRERTGDPLGGICCLPLTDSAFMSHVSDYNVGKFHTTTGTTGEPTYSIYTASDLDMGGILAARMWWRLGARPSERTYVSFSFAWHPFSTFMFNASRRIGVILYADPTHIISFGMVADPLDTAKLFDVASIMATEFDTRLMCQRTEQEGKTLKQIYYPSMKRFDLSGELSKNLRQYYFKQFGDVPITNYYGAFETAWLGGSCLREGDVGMWCHMPEDTHFVELLNPTTGTPVAGMEFGEPAITNLFFESMAFIRWRAEDLVHVRYDPCPYCGYTHMQCRPVGRTCESVEIKGKLITMAEVEDIIYAHPESRPLPIQLIREKRQPQDKLRLRLCYNAQIVKEPEQYRLKVAHELKEEFGVDVEVLLITPGEVGRRYHKFERVVGADGKGKIWPFAGWL